MTKVLFALAAAGTLLASGIATADPVRVAQLDVRIGDHRDRDYDHRGYREREFRGGVRGEFGGCRTVTIRERHGDSVVVRKIRRC